MMTVAKQEFIDESYTVTFDSEVATQTAIQQITCMESKWYRCVEDATLRDLNPVAIFIDARLANGDSEHGHPIVRIKNAWPTAPIILIGDDTDSDLIAESMALGADDFVGRPMVAAEVGRRFHIRSSALVRRAKRESIVFGDMTIDTLQHSVSSSRGQKFLSSTEIKLLSELAKAGGNIVPRETLKTRCWSNDQVSDNALNRKLYEIRRRLKPISDSISIRTIYGVGFVMERK